MKTNERMVVWSRLASVAIGLAGLAGACGGTASSPGPAVGSESHFLARCSGECGGGFDCIGGICTRSCITEGESCTDLGASVACTNESVEPGEVAVCDARCTTESECAPLGSGYECDGGFCRRGAATNGRESEQPPASCDEFLDADVLDITGIGVFNAGTRAIYVQPDVASCSGSQPLVRMLRDDGGVPISANGCMSSCQQVIENGYDGRGGTQPGFPECPDEPCGASPVLIEPGQTLFRPVAREVFPVSMPQLCFEGVAAEAVYCYTRKDPTPGTFTLIVSAATELVCRDPAQDCSCQPTADGTCANPNVTLYGIGPLPLEFSLDGVTTLNGQIVSIAAPEP